MKYAGPALADDDVSLAAHLLRLRDPITGGPLSDDRLLPEIATFFIAGFGGCWGVSWAALKARLCVF